MYASTAMSMDGRVSHWKERCRRSQGWCDIPTRHLTRNPLVITWSHICILYFCWFHFLEPNFNPLRAHAYIIQICLVFRNMQDLLVRTQTQAEIFGDIHNFGAQHVIINCSKTVLMIPHYNPSPPSSTVSGMYYTHTHRTSNISTMKSGYDLDHEVPGNRVGS